MLLSTPYKITLLSPDEHRQGENHRIAGSRLSLTIKSSVTPLVAGSFQSHHDHYLGRHTVGLGKIFDVTSSNMHFQGGTSMLH